MLIHNSTIVHSLDAWGPLAIQPMTMELKRPAAYNEKKKETLPEHTHLFFDEVEDEETKKVESRKAKKKDH
ncbi:hypothetical protein QE152_g19749 [Popillia japonica]|uniref:Uncharacterized protein n=1 Tax=Popillia japonica TaxID=7064 RepID=A0AAW1KMV9_POPJA